MDSCTFMLSYNDCDETEFFCEQLFIPTGVRSVMTYDCSPEFSTLDFWTVMREEQWWQDNWANFSDFYLYWDEFHNTSTCEMKEVYVTCDDFNFTNDTCTVVINYDTCDIGNLYCWADGVDEFNQDYSRPCNQDFLHPYFWSQMQAEEYWNLHPEYDDFWQYWT